MNNVARWNRGQVLIIFVFAIIGLIGITGVAIDGSNIYSDRRHAQNAADTAALAAAVVRVNMQHDSHGTNEADCRNLTAYGSCASAIINAAMDRATSNGYTNLVDGSTVTITTPPTSGPYADCSQPWLFNCRDYIQVTIGTTVDTWFAKVLGVRQLHNTVQGTALAKFDPAQSLYGGNSLVALRPTGQGGGTACPGEVGISGNATVTLIGGGIFVNSSNEGCAFKLPNCNATIDMQDGAKLQGVGGPFPGCEKTPPWNDVTDPYPFPPTPLFGSTLIPPPQCGETYRDSIPVPTDPNDGMYHYQPGHYMSLPPEKNVFLEPGVYCVENLVKTLASTTAFKGDNIFLYVRPGGSFNFQGGEVRLTGRTEDPYKGYLLYVDFRPQDFYSGVPAQNCHVNAGVDDFFKGVIYAPYCDVEINGGSGSVGISAQVIAYTLTINGGAGLTFYYNQQDAPQVPEANQFGLSH